MEKIDRAILLVSAALSKGESIDEALATAKTALERIEQEFGERLAAELHLAAIDYISAKDSEDYLWTLKSGERKSFLTRIQAGILDLLIDKTADGGAVSTKTIKRGIQDWEEEDPSDSAVYAAVRALKKKLEEAGAPDVIGTKRNHGFYLQNLRVRQVIQMGGETKASTYEFGPDGVEAKVSLGDVVEEV